MKKVLSTLVGTSVLATASIGLSSISASALTLTGDVSCATSNVSGSVDCQGAFSGNDSNQDLGGLFGIDQWMEFEKVDNSSGTSGALTVTAAGDEKSGTWSLSTIPSSPQYMIVLKGGPSFSAYLMDDDTLSGTWNTLGIQTGGRNPKAGPGLSHFTVYKAVGGIVTPPPDDSNPTPVPEPLTILGAGAAIGFGGTFKRKLGKAKKNDKKA